MRDLAIVARVTSVNKMYQKDKIAWITVDENAYEYIVPNTTKVGDLVVVIGEGSLLPEKPQWEFLRKRCYLNSEKAFLIRPMVMGKKENADGTPSDRLKSWGLCVTLAEAGLSDKLKAGTDVTEDLEIRKYEPAEDASPAKTPKTPKWVKFCMKHALLRWIGKLWFDARKSKNSGGFPTDIIQKSDETTIQNYKAVVSEFAGKKAYITAKMEGQSFTCSLDAKKKYSFYVCSRNNRFDAINSTSEVFFKTAESYDIEKKLRSYLKKTGILLMLQGEQCGPGIQSCIYNFESNRLFLYRMKGLENGKWIDYPYPKMKSIADELGFDCVPLLEVVDDMAAKFNVVSTDMTDETGKAYKSYNTIEVINDLVKYAENIFWKPTKDGIDYHYQPKDGEKLWKDYLQAEGVVIKSDDYNKEENSGFSFKVKNVQYAEQQYTDMHAVARKIINSLK